MNDEQVKEMAEAHYRFLQPLIVFPAEMGIVKYLYVQALIHGYKHGQEDTIGEVRPEA